MAFALYLLVGLLFAEWCSTAYRRQGKVMGVIDYLIPLLLWPLVVLVSIVLILREIFS